MCDSDLFLYLQDIDAKGGFDELDDKVQVFGAELSAEFLAQVLCDERYLVVVRKACQNFLQRCVVEDECTV